MGEINTVFLSLGSNLGRREALLNEAIQLMATRSIHVVKVSSFFYSAPVGFESTNQFCNICAKATTELSPLKLLGVLNEIEQTLGRSTKSMSKKYADRLIDIDIIFYNFLSFKDDKLCLPHPEWNKRPFVYFPLIDLLD